MSCYHITALFSGSGGNCFSVGCGGCEILIDCGVSVRALSQALAARDLSLDRIAAIFITHEHIDHVRALRVLTKHHHIPIHITAPSAKALTENGLALTDDYICHPPLYGVQTGAFSVQSFETSHDSVCCVGYRIEAALPGGGTRTLCIATDTGCVTDGLRAAAAGADDVIIESNHDENMLLIGRYPYDLKRRILSGQGHLSNRDCGDFLSALAAAGTRSFMLAHLSEENNYPALAQAAAEGALRDAGIAPEECRIAVAAPHTPVSLIELP